MADGTLVRDRHDNRLTLAAAASPGEIYQLGNGLAAVLQGQTAGASGDRRSFTTTGKFTIPKTASVVVLDGAPIWWDHSANTATPIPGATDRDFYLGTAVGDAAGAGTTLVVDLNVKPEYFIELQRDAFRTLIVKTVVGSTTVEVPDVKARGGAFSLILGTTAEAQKVDLLSEKSFAKGSKWIVEGTITVIENSDAAAGDFNVGVANATHASDADSITESAFIHTNGNDLNLYAESDDGTTEVAATDTTVDFVVGTPFHFAIDGRDLADIQMYINALLVLPSSTFKLDAATGPLKLLAHLEKSSDDSPGTYSIDRLSVRLAETR